MKQKVMEYISKDVTTLATCWKLVLKNGKFLGFTDFDQDIIYKDKIYKADSGFTASAIESNSKIAADDNFQVQSMISCDQITEHEVLSGALDNADVSIFLLDYSRPSLGHVLLKSGNIGKIKVMNKKFVAEIKGIKNHLDWHIGKIYSEKCRANLGDKFCKIDLTNFTSKAKITEILGKTSFKCADLENLESNYFNHGVISFGENYTQNFEIVDFRFGMITLAVNPHNLIKIGKEVTLIAGCNKKISCCSNKFNNALNFRGEPHIPLNINLS